MDRNDFLIHPRAGIRDGSPDAGGARGRRRGLRGGAALMIATAFALCAVSLILWLASLAPSPASAPPVIARYPGPSSSTSGTSEPLTYGLPTVTLEEGLAKMQRRVSLPDPEVAGVPIAVMISHAPKGANSLWIQYSSGVFLQIEPRRPGQGPGVFSKDYAGLAMRHPDGSPYIRTERVAGRDTVVATSGELVAGAMPAQIREDFISWIENGYVYILQPRTKEATLPVLLGVAASTR